MKNNQNIALANRKQKELTKVRSFKNQIEDLKKSDLSRFGENQKIVGLALDGLMRGLDYYQNQWDSIHDRANEVINLEICGSIEKYYDSLYEQIVGLYEQALSDDKKLVDLAKQQFGYRKLQEDLSKGTMVA